MGYRLDNKNINLKGLKKIGTGKSGDVYRYKGQALKVFKSDSEHLNEETAKILKSIHTDRILLPRNLLYYNNALRGYTLKSLDKRGHSKKIITIPKESLIDEVTLNENDIESLSKKSILLNGVAVENSIFNGQLFLTDPSQYSLLELFSTEEIERLNRFQFHLFITELISQELNKINTPKSVISEMKEIMNMKEESEKTSSFLQYAIDTDDSIKEFVKRL